MNGPDQSRRRRFFLLLAPLLLASVAIPAARTDAAEGAASAGDVADGLKKIESSALEVAEYAGTDKAKAEKYAAEIEPTWKKIEDVVRDNDKNSYIAFEDAIDDLASAAKAGDAKKAGGAAGALSSAVKFYVAKFPGAAAAAAPARGADAAPAVAPKEASAAPKTADTKGASAAPKEAAAAAPAVEAGEAALARTGKASSAVAALAGAAFGLGGLALIGGARRRRTAPTA